MAPATRPWTSVLNYAVIVSALGYFVDIYDLLLFVIVGPNSLHDLGYALGTAENSDIRLTLLNVQMVGLLLGGVLWGVLGDKRGRVTILFGSILLYSLANISNAFVTSIEAYAVFRLLAGIGLAGELGAAVTLVSEILPKETRGYGTAIVASVGILGAVAAVLVGDLTTWRISFLIGGALGLVLLIARFSLVDSGMYKSLRAKSARRGDLTLLFTSRERFSRYAYSLLVGLPVWFVIGILVGQADVFAKATAVTGLVTPAYGVLWSYSGAALGDLASGFLSNIVRSRRVVLIAFVTGVASCVFIYVFSSGLSPTGFYTLLFFLGFFAGYWAVFVTNAAEQFGTNLRATVATTAPNFARGALIPITLAFTFLRSLFGDPLKAVLVVGALCVLIALFSVRQLKETYGKDLDYVEGEAVPGPRAAVPVAG